LGGPNELPSGSPTLKCPKQVCSIYPSLEKFKNLKAEITMSNVTSNCLGHWVDRLNELKIDKGPGSLGFIRGQDPKPFAQEWVKWSGGGEGKFPGFP